MKKFQGFLPTILDLTLFRRYFVIYHLPKLTFLDSTKVRNNERREALRVGEFMHVIRPDVNQVRIEFGMMSINVMVTV